MRKSVLLLPFAFAVAACGLRTPLQLPPGEEPPPVPAMADEPLSSEELLERPPIARPERVDEILTESEEREDDRFDLPPD